MSRIQRLLSSLPDADDALRRLADVLQVPFSCRKRACRRERRCQGGHGPPCYFERRNEFADAVREHMDAHRDYWEQQRESIAAVLKR